MKRSSIIFFLGLIMVCFSFSILKSQDNSAVSIVKDGNPITFSSAGDSCFGTGQEKHDDGSFENGAGWNATVTQGRFVQKFRPSVYPWKYNKFCIAFTRLAAGVDSLQFDVVIYDSTGAGGTPGTLLGTLPNQVAKPIPVFALFQWFSYDISSVTGNLVNNGAVYIGIKYDASPTNQASKFVMFDQNATAPVWPGYAWANADPWIEAQNPLYWPMYKGWAMRTIGASPGGAACNFNWTAQTSGTTQALLSVSAVSNDVAWAGGNGPTVIRTTNGSSWSSATGTGMTGNVFNIWGIDANTALCTTSPGATFIYRTSNGGTTWTQVFTQATPGFIDGIKMVDANTGYAMGDPVGGFWVILKTTNGGVNWTQLPGAPAAPTGEAGWNNSFDVEGNNIWWLTNTVVGKVYHSTNGGTTFTSSNTGLATGNYGSIKFAADGLNGIVSSTTGTAVRSTDGGATWSNITTIPGAACTAVETGLNAGNVNFWGTGGSTIQRSTNSGSTWSLAFTAAGAINDLYFSTLNGCPVGWAVGVGGVIAKMSLVTGISNYNTEIPDSYNLNQNYPNPFNPSTNISFSLPKSGFVTLKIYDMVGREVASLLNEFKPAGNYLVGFNAANLTSGTYFYRLESNDFIATKKMVLLK